MISPRSMDYSAATPRTASQFPAHEGGCAPQECCRGLWTWVTEKETEGICLSPNACICSLVFSFTVRLWSSQDHLLGWWETLRVGSDSLCEKPLWPSLVPPEPWSSFVVNASFLVGCPTLPLPEAAGTIETGIWTTPGLPERHLNSQQVWIWEGIACSLDLLYKFCTVGVLCLGLSLALCAEMTPELLILLHFKGIPGVLRQAAEKPVLFQDFWAWMSQALVMPLKLEMTLRQRLHSTSIRRGGKACGALQVAPPGREELEKLDSHAPLCPCRQNVLPSTHFSFHELICPDSCQISPLTPGVALARPQIFPFRVYSSFKKFFSTLFQGWIKLI